MRGKYHEIWIANAGEKLFVSFADTDHTDRPGMNFRDYRTVTRASRKRLASLICQVKSCNVYLHPEGPSVTYQIRRGHKFPSLPRTLSIAA